MEYTSGQTKALTDIQKMIDSKIDGYYLLAGYAGTGKTTLIENIVNYANSRGKGVSIMAPTNNAVKVIKKKMKEVGLTNTPQTIHKSLFGEPEKDSYGRITFGKPKNIENSVIIVDESSLLDESLLEKLLQATRNKKNQVIFLGDGFQLEPVGKDPKLFDILKDKTSFGKKFNINIYDATQLTEVRRQSLDSNILKLATGFRKTNKTFVFDESKKDVKIMKNKDDFYTTFYESMKKNEDAVMVVATNKERNSINQKAREFKFGKGVGVLETGDVLVSIGNSETVANGEMLIVKKINDDFDNMIDNTYTIPIQTEGGDYRNITFADHQITLTKITDENGIDQTIMLVPNNLVSSLYHQVLGDAIAKSNDELKSLLMNQGLLKSNQSGYYVDKSVIITTYGYAITAHKSQGGQWKKVFVNQNYVANSWNPARWLYTAITRASDELYLLEGGYKRLSTKEIDDLIFDVTSKGVTNKVDSEYLDYTEIPNIDESNKFIPPPTEPGYTEEEDDRFSPIKNKIPNRNKQINKAQDIASKWIEDSNCKR